MSSLHYVTPGLAQHFLSLSFLLCTKERYSSRGRAVKRQRARNREVEFWGEGVGQRVRLLFLPSLQLAELQCEVAALRKEQKVLSGLVESLGTHIRALMEQQQQLRSQLEDLNSKLLGG